jgi:hypothetical protein
MMIMKDVKMKEKEKETEVTIGVVKDVNDVNNVKIAKIVKIGVIKNHVKFQINLHPKKKMMDYHQDLKNF